MSKLKYLNGAVTVLKWTVLYPVDKENSILTNFVYFIWALFFVSSFMTTVIQCVMYLLTTEFDFVKNGMVIMNSVLYVTLFINFFLFSYHSDRLVKLVKDINSKFVAETDNHIETVTMAEKAQFCDRMSYFWTWSVIASGVLTGTLPLFMGDRSIMPIQGWFPYDYTKSPQYELSFLWQMFCQFNLGLIYGASDMIFPNMTIIIGQQFHILASNFSNCFYKIVLDFGETRERVLEFKTDLKNYSLSTLMEKYATIFDIINSQSFQVANHVYLSKNIKHHQLLLRVCEDLNKFMSPYLLLKVLLISFNTVFIIFTLMTNNDRTILVGLGCYAFFGNAELFIYNYGGQILIENADILWDVYDCPWYLCDLRFQKTFLFVQQRLCKIVQTKAGSHFVMSAETFISFIRGVFSYSTVLKEVIGDDK